MNTVERLAALGFAHSLEDMIKKKDRGRLQNQLSKLKELAHAEIVGTCRQSKFDVKCSVLATEKITLFDRRVGWSGNLMPVTTYVGFLTLLFEKFGDDKILRILGEIADYFNRISNDTQEEYEEAVRAFGIWEEVMNEM